MEEVDVKQEPDDFYDSRLEPDVVILDDSVIKKIDYICYNLLIIIFVNQDESNVSLSTSNNSSCSPKYPGGGVGSGGSGSSVKERLKQLKEECMALGQVRDTGFLQQCPECKKYFKRLESHITTQHLREYPAKPYACSLCHKLFRSVSNLSVHERTHSGVRPYVCNVCGKGFTQSGNLVHHSRIHTGARPYKCPVCDRAFTQPGNLQNHVRLHNQDKPFRCHVCEKGFTQSSNLNSHLRNNHKELHGDPLSPAAALHAAAQHLFKLSQAQQ